MGTCEPTPLLLLCLQAVSSFPWLAFCSLCAEEQYEVEERVWKALLLALKNDAKVTLDAALKVSVLIIKL